MDMPAVAAVPAAVAVQTYTYDIKPIKDTSRPNEQKLVLLGSTASSEGPGGTVSTGTADGSDNIHSYEVSADSGAAPCYREAPEQGGRDGTHRWRESVGTDCMQQGTNPTGVSWPCGCAPGVGLYDSSKRFLMRSEGARQLHQAW